MAERDERVDDGAGGGADAGGGGMAPSGQQQRSGEPEGDVYEWFRRGARLLAQGNPAAAEQLLARAAEAEPGSRSIREALARAQFDAGSYAAALENFRTVALADPSDDYAQFGWGVAAARLGDFEASAEHGAGRGDAAGERPLPGRAAADPRDAGGPHRGVRPAAAGGAGLPGAAGRGGRAGPGNHGGSGADR